MRDTFDNSRFAVLFRDLGPGTTNANCFTTRQLLSGDGEVSDSTERTATEDLLKSIKRYSTIMTIRQVCLDIQQRYNTRSRSRIED